VAEVVCDDVNGRTKKPERCSPLLPTGCCATARAIQQPHAQSANTPALFGASAGLAFIRTDVFRGLKAVRVLAIAERCSRNLSPKSTWSDAGTVSISGVSSVTILCLSERQLHSSHRMRLRSGANCVHDRHELHEPRRTFSWSSCASSHCCCIFSIKLSFYFSHVRPPLARD
jgi:hypothetical protein